MRTLSHLFNVSIVLLLSILAPTLSKAQEAQRVGQVEILNLDLDQFTQLPSATSELRVFEATRGNSSGFIRVILENVRLQPGDTISIRNSAEEEIDSLSGSFEKAGRWVSNIVFGNKVTIRVNIGSNIKPKIKLAGLLYEFDPVFQNSVFENPDFENVIQLEPRKNIYSTSRSVAFVTFMRGDDFEVCSGFLLSGTTLLTNNHCISKSDECETAAIAFDYVKDKFGFLLRAQQTRCNRVTFTDHDLDFSVVELSNAVNDSLVGLALFDHEVTKGQNAILLQHPAGEHKQFSEKGCAVLDTVVAGRAHNTDFSHRCDTMGGSSGSPIIIELSSTDVCVVGLHHWGFMENGEFDSKNRAVRIDLIARKLSELGIKFAACGA